jgi:single-stranded DNA-binding protein
MLRENNTAMANNMITFEGNLASELNIRYTSSGKQVASVNLIHNHTRKNSEGKYERTGKTTSMRAVLWQEVLEGYQFSKGDLLGVTGYLKERQWTDSQGQNHRLNELVVTGITKHLPKGMGKTQAELQQLEMPLVEEAAAARPKRKPRKGIIRVGAAV